MKFALSVDRKSLAEESMKRQCFKDYSIKTKYFDSVNPYLSKNFDITTKYEFAIIPDKPKTSDE